MTLSAYSPTHEDTGIAVSAVLSWADSVDSDHYEVYFSVTEADVTAKATACYRGNVTEKTYDPRVTLDYNTEYFWRIVAVLSGESDVDSGNKSFTTLSANSLPVAVNYRKRLCAAADDKFFYENDEKPPRMIVLTDLTLDTDSPFSMLGYQQKVYIANGTIHKVVDFVNTKIVVTGMTDEPTRGLTLTQATTGAEMIVDFVNDGNTQIYGRTIGDTAFEENAGYDLTSEGMTTVQSTDITEPTVPHYYDWTTFAGDTTNFGQLPARFNILKQYRNRLAISGNDNDPHQWYLLRQDNPYDAKYAQDDFQSPVAGQDAGAGKIGDIVTACIPYGDDYCLWGSVGAIWVMRGDPADNGSLDSLDDTVGVVDKDAWCKDDRKNLYVLDVTGLYRIPYPLGKPQALVDEDVIPTFIDDLKINPENQRITLQYDQNRKGVQICVTDIQLGTNSNYYYDLVTKGFFPEIYPDNGSVYSMHFYNADEPKYRNLLLGCADGHIRVFDDAAKDDDTGTLAVPASEPIDSWVLLGPQIIGPDYDTLAILNWLYFITAGGGAGGSIADSNDITYDVFFGNDAETVIEKCDADSTPFSGTVTAPGRSNRKRLRGKGVFAGIKIGNDTAGQTWGIERVTGSALRFGPVR